MWVAFQCQYILSIYLFKKRVESQSSNHCAVIYSICEL
jgi:hypothetical protein